ncbi:MAG: hypothetical protein AAGI23_06490 [Bacteroidota bacterium]
MSRQGTTMSTQKLEYDHVYWKKKNSYILTNTKASEFSNASTDFPTRDTVLSVNTKPQGLKTGMKADKNRPPYWVYDYKISSTEGLVITDANVKDTVSSGSIEQVFKQITFSDLKIFFDDNTSSNFNIQESLNLTHPGTLVFLEVGEDGSSYKGLDKLYQRGIKLSITTNALAAQGGTCVVNISFSNVFRGANNDFDPGGVPVAMIAWPQLSFVWSKNSATKKVVGFIGSIKITMNNKMHHSHTHGGQAPPAQNIPGFYTDSNTSIKRYTLDFFNTFF